MTLIIPGWLYLLMASIGGCSLGWLTGQLLSAAFRRMMR